MKNRLVPCTFRVGIAILVMGVAGCGGGIDDSSPEAPPPIAGTVSTTTVPSADVLETVTAAQLHTGLIELLPTQRQAAVSAEEAEQAARELFGDAPVQEVALARCLSVNGELVTDPCWVVAFVPSGEAREIRSPIPVPEGEENPDAGGSEVVMTVQVAFVDATTGTLFDALETNAPPEGFHAG
jgi:hypothetical protein